MTRQRVVTAMTHIALLSPVWRGLYPLFLGARQFAEERRRLLQRGTQPAAVAFPVGNYLGRLAGGVVRRYFMNTILITLGTVVIL
jgi:hypothetical protein